MQAHKSVSYTLHQMLLSLSNHVGKTRKGYKILVGSVTHYFVHLVKG